MRIAAANKEDLNALYLLERNLFGHHAYPRFFFRQAFDCWKSGLVVAKEDEQIAGYVLMAKSDEKGTHWILSLAVDTQHRGKGIARLLVEQVLNQVKVGELIKLTVDPNNVPACQLYCSLGFIVKENEANYFDDDEPRLVMQLTR